MEFSYNQLLSVLSYWWHRKQGGCRQGSRTQLCCANLILGDMSLTIFLAENGQRWIAGVEKDGFSYSLGGHAAQCCAVPASIFEGKVEPSSTCLWGSQTHFFLRKDRLCKEESPLQQHCASSCEWGKEWEKEATRGLRHLVTTNFDPGVSICLLLMQLCGEAAFSQNQS